MPKIIVDSPKFFMFKWDDDPKNSYPQAYPQATSMQGACQQIVDNSVDKALDSTIVCEAISVWRVSHNHAQNAPQSPTGVYNVIHRD